MQFSSITYESFDISPVQTLNQFDFTLYFYMLKNITVKSQTIIDFVVLPFLVAKEEIARLEEERNQVGRDLFDAKERLLDQLDSNHV